MKLIESADPIPSALKGAVLTLGNFDGLHIGHQALVDRLMTLAKELDAPTVVMSFDPHPVKFLHPDRDFRELFPLSDLKEQLEVHGVDGFIVKPFNSELAGLEPNAFLQTVVVDQVSPKAVVVGHDFRFGFKRSGDIETLKKFFLESKVLVEKVEPVTFSGKVVSSSLIRECLAQGHVEKAHGYLGRPFELRGQIVHGQKRGQGLGFPTANLGFENEIAPRIGVYITEFEVSGQSYRSLTNIGFRPTFESNASEPKLTSESFLIDADIDLYSKPAKVRFLKWLREEKAFVSADELVAQIRIDVKDALAYFARPNV